MSLELRTLCRAGAMLVLLAVTACAGAGNEQIAQVAQSGEVFATQAPRVYDVVFASAVNRDSADLEQLRKRAVGRPEAVQAAVRTAFVNNTKLLSERLAHFNTMKSHARLLDSYFTKLNVLASGGDSAAAGQAASNAANELEKLAPGIKDISIGGRSLNGLVGPLVSLAVSTFANSRLQEHLKTSAPKVQEAIALQRSMFALLLDQERARAKAAADAAVKVAFDAFDKPLPETWAAERLKTFAPAPIANALSAALDAADELQSNYEALVTGGDGSLNRLQNALALVGAVVTVFESNTQQ
ncbi:hypothetical protein GCM10017083_52070 [Thalassobaculum fulvum]|uniref:Lipoprotein n=1 Tax=Thalassobaculum fulvum TaxID=1633335 RepID=A0A919CSC2_9PROT|nr:hypothetical protein [Thalassobaculum fulvum]GHD62779.1 hypothetical protein GCM10017083_52070 [Thalassobaculum fulvum]